MDDFKMPEEGELKENRENPEESAGVPEAAAAEAEAAGAAAEMPKKRSTASIVLEWVRDIAIAVLIAVILSQFITPTIVKEHSMDDTLHNNNYLILWKMAYKNSTPDYGDIVVFKSDLPDDKGDKKLLIKRVVAVGGDTVALRDGYVYRNGQMLTESYTKDGYTNGEMEETVVPEGKLFLLGDNRLVSVDSRSADVGFVSEDRLVGKAVLRLYPFNQIGGLYKNYSAE